MSDFYRAGGFEEKLHRLDQVGAGVLDGLPLTGDVQLRAESDAAVVLALDDRRDLLSLFHLNNIRSQGDCRKQIDLW
jgi:hypothetical protein